MDRWLGLVAVLAPVVQIALMGFIGYPLSRRTPGGLERFRRSGFTWWLITLSAVVLVALATAPALLAPDSPSRHIPLSVTRVAVTVVIGVVVVATVELTGSSLLARATSGGVARGRDRYESALPPWAAGPASESALVGGTALLEEAVYRGILIASLVTVWGLPVEVVAGVSAVAFAAAHWYYGWAQMTVKLLVGAALASVALSAGWLVAAAVHVVVNIALTAQAHRAEQVGAGR